MISPLKIALIAVAGLAMLPATMAAVNSHPASALLVEQLSYHTRCAEEDNVILRMRPAVGAVAGVNILPRKPVFARESYRVSTAPDFTGCLWSSSPVAAPRDYHPGCPGGYRDRGGVCRPAVAVNVLAVGRWVVKAERGVHWQPFMTVLDPDGRRIGEFKSLTVARFTGSDGRGEAPEVAVLYSDGYLRPMYSARAAEASGWGGSFILGDPRRASQEPLRYHSNVRQVRLLNPGTGDLVMELRFADAPDTVSRLVLHSDYDRQGIDWFPSVPHGQLLSFVSMYREHSAFDVELLAGDDGHGYREYPIMDPRLDGAVFGPAVWLAKQNPSDHNTLAPDFLLTVR